MNLSMRNSLQKGTALGGKAVWRKTKHGLKISSATFHWNHESLMCGTINAAEETQQEGTEE